MIKKNLFLTASFLFVQQAFANPVGLPIDSKEFKNEIKLLNQYCQSMPTKQKNIDCFLDLRLFYNLKIKQKQIDFGNYLLNMRKERSEDK